MFTQDQIEAISRRSAVHKYQLSNSLETDFILFNDLLRSNIEGKITFERFLNDIIISNTAEENKTEINRIIIYSKAQVEQGIFNAYTEVEFENDVEKFFSNFKFPLDQAILINFLVSVNFAAVII